MKSAIIHDGEIAFPAGCPRGLACLPLARVASEGFASFMCCGDNAGDASVPTDRFRLCIKSTHDARPADVMVNLDERDVIDTASVLMGALSSNAAVKGNPMESIVYGSRLPHAPDTAGEVDVLPRGAEIGLPRTHPVAEILVDHPTVASAPSPGG